MIRLHDTLSRERRPLPDGPVRLYVCGVTPYDTTHLGHAVTFIQSDLLVRALRWLGREVIYVQNVTDIDDSILGRARALGVSWKALGDEGTARFLRDMRDLAVTDPDHYVAASAVMPTILEMISVLLERRAAYRLDDGTVYFRVAAAPRYGELSRLARDEMLAIAERQDDADVDDPRKEEPLDFALWKGWSGEADEPWWESPWGRGRPGWHIECSAVNLAYHGPQLTIHGGGSDLVFPHHESEIAQTEIVTGVRPFARIWMHVAMTRMDGEKMSKSLGNMVFATDLVRRYGPDAVRIFVLSTHYREPVDWSDASFDRAVERTRALEARLHEANRDDGASDRFRIALEDDLDAPRALEAAGAAAGEPLREMLGVLGLPLVGAPAPVRG